MKLNLGCGKDIKNGYVNLDCVKLAGVDVVHDIEKTPYPFKAGTFTEIYASHVLEHLTDLALVMEELCRISKKGGRIIIHVPYFSNPGAFGDPTHKRFFTYNTFDYFVEGGSLSYYSSARVKIARKRIMLVTSRNIMARALAFVPQMLIDLMPSVYQRFFAYILPAAELQVELIVEK